MVEENLHENSNILISSIFIVSGAVERQTQFDMVVGYKSLGHLYV